MLTEEISFVQKVNNTTKNPVISSKLKLKLTHKLTLKNC